ncbi:sugar phosphate isomerase/epimerase [Asinibacterium sp. OR53]|uniref:sugar phosphate isomerase/epimerase family protein n=2 Tax=Pseudomonadati TaxID=3379134 RepID=UPI00047C08C5|nr:sugar phosphate isomerase/epimerase family protein [Asinibacterium sp. OR53]
MKSLARRKFLQTLATGGAALGLANTGWASALNKQTLTAAADNRFKISLNAYSFNGPLTKGTTDLEAVMDFSAKTGFDAIDLTGYYFPGYPEVPTDEYIYRLKQKAHTLGLGISGTGIRNEFAEPNEARREAEILFVKKWIDAAAKLGAPVIRVFSGKTIPANHTWEQTEAWIVDAFQQCAAYGKQKGVIVAVQNHNDFIKTAAQTLDILKKVNSEWFGLVLDTGSFVTEEPYSEMAKAAPYAVNWQIKEKLNYQGRSEDMDLQKLAQIIHASPYRGYLPIETLSPGDPFEIVPPFLKKVKAYIG